MSENIIAEWASVGIYQMSEVARWVYTNNQSQIILLSGSVGAGKTTFVKEFLLCCGEDNFEGSPSFSYYNLYTIHKDGEEFLMIHMDMYNVESDDNTFQMEFEELQLLNKKVLFFIENYNPLKGLLLLDYIVIYFKDIASVGRRDTRKIWIQGK